LKGNLHFGKIPPIMRPSAAQKHQGGPEAALRTFQFLNFVGR
jgi:hypothetical protein